MKRKADPDLAAWCAALASPIVTDEVPPGWHTCRELGEKLGKADATIGKLLSRAVAEGRAERRLFRIATGAGARPVPHYKLR